MVGRTDDEIYVLSTIKICSYYCFLCCTKKGRIVEKIEIDIATLKTVTVKQIWYIFSVSPYCTLLFTIKKNIKFSKVALVAVHWNYMSGWIMIARKYRPWKTANNTADIYLLVENAETKCKVCSNFFLSAVWLPQANPNIGAVSLTQR